MDLQQQFNKAGSVLEAVAGADLQALVVALEKGALVDERDGVGNTPLLSAVRQKNLYLAGMLLGYDPDVNAKNAAGETPLQLANQNDDLTDLLLQFGADPLMVSDAASREYLLQRAAVSGADEAARSLLSENVSPHRVWGKENASLLVLAARAGQAKTVGLLLEAGVDVNKCDDNGCSALRGALKAGDLACVRLLLAAGADPGIEAKIDPNAAWKTETDFALSQTCLPEIAQEVEKADRKFRVNRAAATGDESTVATLLADGEPPDTIDRHGKTALLHACEQKSYKIVTLLLQHKADPAGSGKTGECPLIVSVRLGDIDSAGALMSAGAGTYAKDRNGETVVQLAEKSGRPALLDLVEDRRREEIDTMADNAVRLGQQVSPLKKIKFRPQG
jgi:uncharacterized protein